MNAGRIKFYTMRAVFVSFLIVFSMSVSGQSDFGLQLYSFRNQFAKDIPGTLQRISFTGIRFVEAGDTYGMQVDSFKSLLKKNQLQVVSIGVDYKELSGDLSAVIAKATSYGAVYVVCFWIPHSGAELNKAEADQAIEVFTKAGQRLKEAGLNFCYHPHGFEFATEGSGTLLDYMIQRTDPASVNFEMDVFWIKQPDQDPLALLQKYPGRFPLLHLKDRKIGSPGSRNGQADVETNVMLGTGDVGITAIVQEARKQGARYMFIEDESSRSEFQVPASWKFLQRIK